MLAEREAPLDAVPRRPRPRHRRRGAGSARARVPSVLSEGAQALRPVHGPRRLDEAGRVPDERDARHRAAAALLEPPTRTATTTAACSPSARTAGSTSRWATAARPATPRTAPRTCARSSESCSRSTSPRRASEIEALGLRNAWRFSFDRANGDLYIGDVGQGDVEEIDYLPRGAPASRTTAGTSTRAARSSRTSRSAPASSSCPSRSTATARAARSPAATSTAARTPRSAAATSTATTAAERSGASSISGGKATGLRRERFKIESVTSFGQDNAGELYGVSHGGTIYRLTP